ncbi:MAG: UDP-N-acetylglucosamine 4,6-dehydratase (inverting) [Candidatus Zixiibacteriota bacterium]|nr:MAG: UDP-N-acetylglucosamine 4,6-dehydratase (inverting) [candidate division Zixibacteria bacterium]
MFSGKALLVTGGTGSFGKKFIETVLLEYPSIRRIVVYSRDELKQFEMSQVFCEKRYPQMRYFIGDVRDKERLTRAMEGIDIVVHAAALKQVPACEYNPFEAIRTNIIGAQNVIDAAINNDVKRVVALSTDKAAAPINLYGATKLCSDKLFVSANNHKGNREIRFSVVRYGNVMGSRGSVIPFFMKKKDEGTLPITDDRMTRFNITLQEGVGMVFMALDRMWGGEIFVPKIPSYRIMDVAEAVAPGCNKEITGIRPGEKLHEEMITATDALCSLEFDDYFVILPSVRLWDVDEYASVYEGHRCREGFAYSSDTNDRWLSVEDLTELIRDQVEVGVQAPQPSVPVLSKRAIDMDNADDFFRLAMNRRGQERSGTSATTTNKQRKWNSLYADNNKNIIKDIISVR